MHIVDSELKNTQIPQIKSEAAKTNKKNSQHNESISGRQCRSNKSVVFASPFSKLCLSSSFLSVIALAFIFSCLSGSAVAENNYGNFKRNGFNVCYFWLI